METLPASCWQALRGHCSYDGHYSVDTPGVIASDTTVQRWIKTILHGMTKMDRFGAVQMQCRWRKRRIENPLASLCALAL
jgi:hypothetical protein